MHVFACIVSHFAGVKRAAEWRDGFDVSIIRTPTDRALGRQPGQLLSIYFCFEMDLPQKCARVLALQIAHRAIVRLRRCHWRY